MWSEWASVEALIRELGALQHAADAARAAAGRRAAHEAQAAIAQAMIEATEAVGLTFDLPTRADLIAKAWEHVEVARQVVTALHADVDPSRRVAQRSGEFRERARELIEQARKATEG